MDIVAFSLGGLPVYWYGLTVSFAIGVGALVTGAQLRYRKENMPLAAVLIFSIVFGCFFSRLAYAALHWPLYLSDPGEIFAVWRGGMSIYGAFAGFLLAVSLCARFCRASLWRWLDIFAPALALGIAIDQMGHFAFQATVGMPVALDPSSNQRIVEYVEYAFRPSGFEGFEYFKPVALYLFIWQFFIFILTAGLSYLHVSYRIAREGSVFLTAMLLAALGRFFFGFMYLSVNPRAGLHFGQVVALAGALACAALLIYRGCVRTKTAKRYVGA